MARRKHFRAKPADGMTVRHRVFAALAPGETMTRRELEGVLGLPQSVLSPALYDLSRMGIVRRIGSMRFATWARVEGATAPVDTRGRSRASRDNLTPGDPARLRADHAAWRARGNTSGGRIANKRTAAQELARLLGYGR